VNDILKQRLVGALILVALGVVFWPIIFVGPDAENASEQQFSPPPQEVSASEVADMDQSGLGASTELAGDGGSPSVDEPLATGRAEEVLGAVSVVTPSPAPPASTVEPAEQSESGSNTAPAANEEVQTEAQQPELQSAARDAHGVPMAWSLQVATVSSAEKADTLRQQLLEMKHRANVTTVRSGGKSLYRVSIGPASQRAELEKLQAGINARFGVTSIVMRHTP
jgi:DedD protein